MEQPAAASDSAVTGNGRQTQPSKAKRVESSDPLASDSESVGLSTGASFLLREESGEEVAGCPA